MVARPMIYLGKIALTCVVILLCNLFIDKFAVQQKYEMLEHYNALIGGLNILVLLGTGVGYAIWNIWK